MQRPALTGHVVLKVLMKHEMQSRKSSLSNKSTSSKGYQMPQHCTTVYNPMKHNFTTLGLVLKLYNMVVILSSVKVNGRKTVSMLQEAAFFHAGL